jgi:hypothetical protein
MVENNKLAVITLGSCNPTQLPPANESGIADSGSMGYYFGPNTPVSNYDATAPTMKSRLYNQLQVPNLHQCLTCLQPAE